MGRNPFLLGLFKKTVFFSFAFLALLASAAQADAEVLPLHYFKNYFVTGDYAAAGIGLRGTGVNGFATGTINMTGVPCTSRPAVGDASIDQSCTTPLAVPADIVAAFLYWETEETSTTPTSANGYFRGNAIVGKVLGSPDNPACLSSGGPNGTTQGSGRVYRADVLRYLPIDHTNNIRLANGSHEIKLRDTGGNGNGNTAFTNGATLVVVYRIVVPGQPGGRPGHIDIAPLRAVVSYDGAFTLNKFSDTFNLTMGGFYQPSPAAAAKMTPIVGNGQSNFRESLYITTGNETATVADPFKGASVVGGRWDNRDYFFNLHANDPSYSTRLIAGNNQVCVTIASIWTSTNVQDTDYDGLLDVWETNGMHLDPGDDLHAATFGGCTAGQPCVDLPNMKADPNKKDIFAEIDWMQITDASGHVLHSHIPKYSALSAIGATYASHNIAIHFDVGGTEYQKGSAFFGTVFGTGSPEFLAGSPYIVPAAYARGGDVIDESTLLCHPSSTTSCAFSEPYSVLSWKKGFHAIEAGFRVLGIPRHFDTNRADIFHYVLFSHALAGPFDSQGRPLDSEGNPLPPAVYEPPSSVSGVADRPGGDLMITLGLWRFDDPIGCDWRIDCSDQSGSPQVQAGTLMHELGHNLALSHSGNNRVPNCVPIYQSVMNYLYQTRGLTDAAGFEHIDYSHGGLNPTRLDEDLLPYLPTSSLGTLPYRVRFYGPPITTHEGIAQAYCGGFSNFGGVPAVRVESPNVLTPDWSRGVPGVQGNPLDVNYDGSIEGTFHPGSTLMADSDDWSSLNLQQVGSRRNVNGLSADIGEADLGEADLGEADLGEADLGEADLGEADLGEADLGEADLGEADLGEASFKAETSSPDATSALHPLKGDNTSVAITLTWGAPGLGQVREYRIYRADPAHPVATYLRSVYPISPAITPLTSFEDPVNDFTHSRESCGFSTTCYNTTYTYYITSVVLSSTDPSGFTESGSSNTVVRKVPHLFVIPDNQSVVYGAPLSPLNFTAYSDVLPVKSLSGVTCALLAPQNVGVYAIPCSGPPTAGDVGITYNSLYYDGNNLRTPGTLTITKAPLTITARTNTKTFDTTTAALAVPIVSGLQYSDTVTVLGETYDTANAGTGKTLTVSPGYVINDHNNGNNYTVTVVADHTGVINNANATSGFLPTGSLATARSFHTATLLGNGKVLVTGGFSNTGAPLASAELYDPVAKTFSPTGGNMPNKAAGQTATLLNNGKVLVVGGGNSSSEIYDPVSNTFSSGGGISGQRTYHTATLLPNGKVLIAGGSDQSGKATNAAQLFDPATGSYSNTGSMKTSREFHTATLLPNGKVLIAGGRTSSGNSYTYQKSAELYDPATGTFTMVNGNMTSTRYGHTAILFKGKVLITGGANSSPIATTDVYDPDNGFSVGPAMAAARQFFTAAIFGDAVVEAGGVGATSRLQSAEQDNGAAFLPAANMTTARAAHTATRLSDGSILIIGGQGSAGTSISSAELLK